MTVALLLFWGDNRPGHDLGLQCVVVHAKSAHDFQSIQYLRAWVDDCPDVFWHTLAMNRLLGLPDSSWAKRCFSHAGSKAWNALPAELQDLTEHMRSNASWRHFCLNARSLHECLAAGHIVCKRWTAWIRIGLGLDYLWWWRQGSWLLCRPLSLDAGCTHYSDTRYSDTGLGLGLGNVLMSCTVTLSE